jgi:hypothetical protein
MGLIGLMGLMGLRELDKGNLLCKNQRAKCRGQSEMGKILAIGFLAACTLKSLDQAICKVDCIRNSKNKIAQHFKCKHLQTLQTRNSSTL